MNNALAVLVTAVATYLLRAVPLLLCRKKITSKFLQSFFYYLPYTVISAMTFPAIFTCTGNVLTSLIGTAVAVVLSVCKVSLILVIILAVSAAYLATVLL